MFNKIKSAVTSALPGNPMSRDFDVFGQIATGGPGLVWKIYTGVKKSTKQDAAIFVFEKKSIEKLSRRDKDFILDALRKGASQLTRLRHPKVLSVMQPLEESRESLAFATEPVFGSLANVLGNHDNLPAHVVKELQDYKMFEVEIKYGLLQVTEGLQFLHNDAKLLHNNLCPESIIINKDGAWKLAGFDFCINNKNPPEQAPHYPFQDWDPDIVPTAQPNLDYMAPEYALTQSCGLPSDLFSIGVLIYSIFNNGKPLYECKCQLHSFRKNTEELKKWRGSLLGKIPVELQDIVKLLLNTEPAVRPDPNQLAKISFFEDVGSMTLQYMDSLFQQDNLQKSKFFKGLPKIIVKFPKRVNIQRILPPLVKECINPDMIPFVLPNLLQIAEQSTDKEYTTHILPALLPMFKIVNPIQILLIFMQNMNLLLKKTPASDIKTHVLPMIFRALESNNAQIQELCLDIIPTFADLIEYTSLKTSIIPRIKKLCLGTTVVGVRVNCLLCLGKLLETMDKWFVLDEILPILSQIPSREPAVLMSILGIYRVTLSHTKLGITKDILAGKVLPFLIPLAIENTLNLPQFNAYMGLVKEMIEKVEVDHRGKLEQLEQMKQEQKSMEITKITENDDKTLISGIEEKPKTMMDSFLSGFHISSTTGGSGDKKQGTSQQVSSTSSKGATDLPGQPAKVSLSLEEKQKLAKQQEQQRFMKTQKPLNVKSTTNSTPPKLPASNQPKDLTSSLMQSNMMGLNSSGNKPLNSFGAGSMGSGAMATNTSNNRNPPSAYSSMNNSSFNSSPMNSGMAVGMTPNSMSQGSFGMSTTNNFSQNSYNGQMSGMNSTPQQNKPVDLSSFDNLMSSSSQKPKPPMNQISMNTQNRGMTPMQTTQQGTMGNQSMMGNQGIMGSGYGGQAMNSGYNGQQAMNTGFNSNFQQNSMGSHGNMGAFQSQPMGAQNMLQPQPMGNKNTTNAAASSAAKEFDDLFG